MKISCIATLATTTVVTMTSAFQALPSLSTSRSSTVLFEYVPDGFTPASYKKFKQQEKTKADAAKAKSLGGMGPRGFQSRSMQSFQEAMEKGEAKHLMPMFNAKEKIRKGEIQLDDIPYMQRGGKWDNTDVKGASKKNKMKWLSSDKEYAKGGFKKEQSVSIFGKGEGLDWTGKRKRTGPQPGEMTIKVPKMSKNYKAPNVKYVKGYDKTTIEDKPKKKKLFGLF